MTLDQKLALANTVLNALFLIVLPLVWFGIRCLHRLREESIEVRKLFARSNIVVMQRVRLIEELIGCLHPDGDNGRLVTFRRRSDELAREGDRAMKALEKVERGEIGKQGRWP